MGEAAETVRALSKEDKERALSRLPAPKQQSLSSEQVQAQPVLVVLDDGKSLSVVMSLSRC